MFWIKIIKELYFNNSLNELSHNMSAPTLNKLDTKLDSRNTLE